MAMISPLQQNAQDLEGELAWFARVLDARFKLYFSQNAEVTDISEITPLDLSRSASPYAHFLDHYQTTFAERVALILALIPHIRPQLLDVFFTRNKTFDRKFTEFGGIISPSSGDFVPTGETLAFILAGSDLAVRFNLRALFEESSYFTRHNILRLDPIGDEPLMKAPLRLSDEALGYFTSGQPRRPDFGPNFPARRIETQLTWDDLVLHPGTRKQIDEIATWLTHNDTLMNDWGMAAKLRPGYRSLFYGPPGTGKTMTASLLGKSTGRDVYKIDLSLVVSKFIGETEKNLARVFDQAQYKSWILFLTRPTRCSASAARLKTRMIAMPIRKCRTCCNGLRLSTALPSWLPISAITSTRLSPGVSNRSSTFPCRARKNACACGGRVFHSRCSSTRR